MDAKTLVQLTEERITHLTYVEFMEAMESLEDNRLMREELMSAIRNKTDLERIGRALVMALYHYHQADLDMHNNFGAL